MCLTHMAYPLSLLQAFSDQDAVQSEDAVLVQDVNRLLEDKDRLVNRLKELNDEAEANPQVPPAQHSEEFQMEYSKVRRGWMGEYSRISFIWIKAEKAYMYG